MKEMLMWVLGSFAFIGVFLRSLILLRLKLPPHIATYLMDNVRENGKQFVFEEEYVTGRAPLLFRGLVYLNKALFYISVEQEKEGTRGSGCNAVMTCLRWDKKKIFTFKESQYKYDFCNTPGIYILGEYGSEKVGDIDTTEKVTPYLEQEKYYDLEQDIQDVLAGKKRKVGAILHGAPGNGKSYLIRYFAIKYKLPVNIMSLDREMDNNEIIRRFNNINPPAIVILEDFDSYFDGRKCILERTSFTFDAILNGLDGLYCDKRGVIYFLTTNDIEKVDSSLKARPSRFKRVMEISNPSLEIRRRIFKDEATVTLTAGKTLDECLFIKEQIEVQGERVKGEIIVESAGGESSPRPSES